MLDSHSEENHTDNQGKENAGLPTVDLRQEVCPMTFVRAKLYLDQIGIGQTIEFLLNDGEQMRNVPRSLKDEGHRVERVECCGAYYRLLVRKGQ